MFTIKWFQLSYNYSASEGRIFHLGDTSLKSQCATCGAFSLIRLSERSWEFCLWQRVFGVRVEENVTIVTYSSKFQSRLHPPRTPPGLFSVNSVLMLFHLNAVIFYLFIYFFVAKALVLFCECATKRWQRISPRSNTGNILQQTEVSSVALFLQRILLITEEPALWWECVNSVKLMMDTSCWQPTCLVPCQPTSCRWWANCPAPHPVDELTASSSPGNFEEKLPPKSFPRKIWHFWISLQFLKFQIRWVWAIFHRAESPEAPWLLYGHIFFHTRLFFSRNGNLLPHSVHCLNGCGELALATTHVNPNIFWPVLKKEVDGFKFYLIPASTCNFSPVPVLVMKTGFLRQPFISGLFVTKSLDFNLLMFSEITKDVVYLLNPCVYNSHLPAPFCRGPSVALNTTLSLIYPSSLTNTTHPSPS